jgi:ferric-dicitrate binding protein FerR (iron transport regulator)
MTPEDGTEELIHALLDGSIGKEDLAHLEQVLLKDPEARQHYFALMSTDQMLVDNYELPDHLAMHTQLVAGPQAERARRTRSWWIWGSTAAAVLLALLTALPLLIQREPPPVTVSGSADSYFLIDGVTVNEGHWMKNQRLEVRDGVVVAQLGPDVTACIDGPASIFLEENGLDLDLRRGRVFFRVNAGAPKFKVRAAGATVRHVGTEFGVRVAEGGSCEVHVSSGVVEVDRGPEKGKWTLKPGDAASWLNRGNTRLDPVTVTDFRKDLPGEMVVFEDDFSDPAETPLKGKKPDTGQPWEVAAEKVPTVVGGGKLDTSGGARILEAPFLPETTPNHRQVVLMSFSTRQPSWIWDKQTRLGGIEKIALKAADGTVICSVQARASEGHRWRLRDEGRGLESELTGISALQDNELTLRYDALAGKITLHAGTSTQSEMIAEVPASMRAMPDSLVIWNDDGGDLALKRISVKVVDYP